MSLKGVYKIYRSPAGQFEALKGVNLEVSPKEFIVVVGKSGSGKSTLLHLIAGIDRPERGSICVAGTSIHSLRERELSSWRGRTIGVVFQFFQLLPTLTIAENIILAMDFCSVIPLRKRRTRTIELLDRFGIQDQANKLPSALSGGQQQRAAIARALANEPPIILADEPTGNLDAETANDVLELLSELPSSGTTVLMVTHERDTGRFCDAHDRA
jgi:putative ABC transport system ATP-binding protein